MTLGLMIGMFTLFINNQMLTAELESMHSYEYIDTTVHNLLIEEPTVTINKLPEIERSYTYIESQPVFPEGNLYDR